MKPAGTLIGEIETLLDKFYDGGHRKVFKLYDFLRVTNTTYQEAIGVCEYYAPHVDELEQLAGGDPQLVEAYSHLSKRQINSLVEQMQTIVSDAERYAADVSPTPKQRKPRPKRVKPPEELVRNFQFLEADGGLTSERPERVVGSTFCALYNTRYKTLQVLVGESMTVRGSTVHDWDEERSFTKIIRKPEEFLPQFVSTGWKAAYEMASALRTKANRPTGRSNGDTLILRASRLG